MSSAVVGALRVTLGLDTAAFSAGLDAATGRLRTAGRDLGRLGGKLSLGVTAPLTLIGAGILATAGDFEAGMNRVAAATGAADGEMAALEKAARALGKSTIYSAVEAADAIEMLAKNGASTADILGGALSSSMALAAATGADLAASADLTTAVMLNFRKEAGDLGPVVDGIAGALLASNFEFDDYRLALAQAGGAAGGLGVTLEDFNAVMAATSARFASGADAGTSFKTFLQRLVPQSKAAGKAMDQLGLEFYDASGALKPMAVIAEDLRVALGDLSDEAKSEALTKIFGTDAMRTAIGLMEAGGAGVRALDKAIREASAAEQAAARMKGWKGELEKLNGAMDELRLVVADAGLLDMATRLVTVFGELVDTASEANPTLLRFGVGAAAAAAALGPLLVAAGAVAAAIGVIGAPVALAIAGVAALAAAGVALWQNWDVIREKFPGIAGAVEGVGAAIGAVAGVIGEQLGLSVQMFDQMLRGDFVGAAETVGTMVTALGQSLIDLAASAFPETTAAAMAFSGDLVTGLGEAVTWGIEKFGELDAFLAAQRDAFLAAGRDLIEGLLAGLREKWEAVKAWFGSLAESIPGWIRDPLGIHSPSTVFADIGTNIMEGLAQGLDAEKDGIRDGVGSFAQDIAQQFKSVLTGAVSLREGLSNVLGSLGGRLFDSGLDAGIGMIGGALGIPGFARGTGFAPGGLARINELGGEIVNLPRGAQVIPHDISRRMAEASGEASGGWGGPRGIAVSVSGARGNSEIESMVRAGVAAGLRDYDGRMADRVAGISADPWYRG